MPEHVETRSLYNPEKPGVEQVSALLLLFSFILLYNEIVMYEEKSYFKMVTKRSIEHLHQANLEKTLHFQRLGMRKKRTRENGLFRTHHFRYVYKTKPRF